MDLFGVGIRFGTARLYETLGEATAYFQRPGLALSEMHLAVLVRLLPLRHVAIYVVPDDSAFYRGTCERLPDWLRLAVRIAPLEDRLVLAPAEVLCLLFSHELGFSALFVDTVGRTAHEFRLCAIDQTYARHTAIRNGLHRLGLLADGSVQQYHELNCDMGRTPLHALACCALLNRALSGGAGDIDQAIYTAMVEACSDESADAVHNDLSNRLDKAFLVLWNANTDETAHESVAQAQVLGPLCNRAALRSLCLFGRPSCELFFEAVKHVGPTDTSIALHSMACGVTHVPDAALDVIRRARFAVICLRADLSPDSPLRHTLLLVQRAAETTPFLFVPPSATRDASASASVNALLQVTGATQHDLSASGISPDYTSVVLPLMLCSWWNRTGRMMPDDDQAEEIVADASRCAIDEVSDSPAHTWFFRVMLSLALDSAHHNLMPAERAVNDDAASFADTLRALGVGPQRILANQALRRRRAERVQRMNAQVAAAIDAAREFAKLNPPPMWNSESNAVMLRRYYYYIARCHLTSGRMVSLLVSAVRTARQVCKELDNAAELARLLCPLFDHLLTEWPFMLFHYSDEGDQVPEAIRLESHNYGVVLQAIVAQEPTAPIPLVLCPVLVIAPDQHGTVLSILQFDSLRRRGQITATGVVLCRLDQYVRANMSQMGAMQRQGDEPATHQEYEEFSLDPSDLALPSFSTLRTPLLMQLPNSRSIGDVHFNDDADDPECSCEISIRPSHDDAAVVAAMTARSGGEIHATQPPQLGGAFWDAASCPQ